MDPSLKRFSDKFFEETNLLLDKVEKDLLEFEKVPNENELIESAFRAMHTIKGISGMFGFEKISEFTHLMESVFQLLRDNHLTFDREIFDLTFSSIDHIRALLSDEKLIDATLLKEHNDLISSINQILDNKEYKKPDGPKTTIPHENALCAWQILLTTDEKMFFRGINLINIFRELADAGNYYITKAEIQTKDDCDTWSILIKTSVSKETLQEIFLFIEDNVIISLLTSEERYMDMMDSDDTILTQQNNKEISIMDYAKVHENDKPSKHENVKPTSNCIKGHDMKRLSVDALKLDHLMFLVSELITVNSKLLIATTDNRFTPIKPIAEQIDRLSKMFRTSAFDIRLVPLSDTVLRFQRLIRDLSSQLNKKIELVTAGTDTELDKNTIDQLNEPLMHIIRNCIDHGIETPAQRLKAGKPEKGTIRITATQSGSFVIIAIEDDGVGIDTEKIRKKAIEKGLIDASEKLSREQLFEFIFKAGFSTAQSLTEVSGRGVGMDVVKKKITSLRGEILIESKEGVGTTFTLRLQQSVAIIDSLLFTVEDLYFTVPLSEIVRCDQVSIDEIRKHSGTITFDEQLIPYANLRKIFRLSGTFQKKVKVVIVKSKDSYLALLTDKIVGEHQAVLKPLGQIFKNHKYITSTSQLGDGTLAYMIDTSKIYK